MKFLRLNQALSPRSSLQSRRLQQYLWLGLMLGMSHAQADTALSYQPTLGDYQRFEPDAGPDHAQGQAPHSAPYHATHEAAQPDAATHQHHHQHEQAQDMKVHEHGHEQE